MPRPRSLLAIALALVAIVAAGCRTDVLVAVHVEEDGAGTVAVTATLDRDAAAQLGDPALLAFDDLRTAGWEVADPVAADDGGLRIVLTRPFGSPEQLADVLAEVGGGTDGVFRDVQLRLEDGFGTTTYRFDAHVELTGDLAQFSDPELAAALGGLPLGRTPEELAAAGLGDPDAARLRISVDLPGGAPDTDGEVRGGRAVWDYPLTGGTPTSEDLRSSSTVGSSAPLLVGLGVAVLALAVVVAVVGLVRTRRRA